MKVEELRADYRVTRETETGPELLTRIQRHREAIEGVRSSTRGLSAAAPEPVVSDALPSLSDGWVWARLDAIADIKGGITKDKKRNPEDCELLPYLRVANVQRGFLDLSEMKEIPVPRESVTALLLEPGDVLFNEGGDRDKLGRGWVWNGQIRRCVFQNHVFRARFYLTDSMEPKFISWYANTFGQDYFMAKGKQTTNLASINKTMLSAFPVPIAPLDQQKRIVAEIETQFSRLDEAVANLKRVKANLKRYKAAVLKAAVKGRLVETEAEIARRECRSFETGEQLLQRILDTRRSQWQGKGKYKEPATPDTADLPELPEGWVWATPYQLSASDDTSICAGPYGTIFKAKDFRAKGVPIIFLRHVGPGRYLTHKPGFMDEEKWQELFQPYSVYGGELLITKLGEPPGVCAIFPEGIGPAMVTPDVIKMTVNNQAALSSYLTHYLNSDVARRFSSGAAFGTTRLRLTIPIFREMPVALPPLAEQHRIVDEIDRRLSLIQEAERQLETNNRRAERLRQSVLNAAFSGTLHCRGVPIRKSEFDGEIVYA